MEINGFEFSARLIGTSACYYIAKKGDIVVFPNNLGVTVANMEVAGHGKISNGIFLNESRVFGICERKA